MIPKTFDALAFEQERAAKFQKTESFPVELSSQHNYTDGICYFYVHYGDLELGRYWRHPWGYGWLYQATGVGDGDKKEADTDYQAIALIKLSWAGII